LVSSKVRPGGKEKRRGHIEFSISMRMKTGSKKLFDFISNTGGSDDISRSQYAARLHSYLSLLEYACHLNACWKSSCQGPIRIPRNCKNSQALACKNSRHGASAAQIRDRF